MEFSRTDSETLEEYTLTSDQLQAIGTHPGLYFSSLAKELESYKDMTMEVDSDNLLVVSISLEFVAGYPQHLQRAFRGFSGQTPREVSGLFVAIQAAHCEERDEVNKSWWESSCFQCNYLLPVTCYH